MMVIAAARQRKRAGVPDIVVIHPARQPFRRGQLQYVREFHKPELIHDMVRRIETHSIRPGRIGASPVAVARPQAERAEGSGELDAGPANPVEVLGDPVVGGRVIESREKEARVSVHVFVHGGDGDSAALSQRCCPPRRPPTAGPGCRPRRLPGRRSWPGLPWK